MDSGLIFDIQGYSVHDGPGGRTLVFLKGCPLRCAWCSNPEGIAPEVELLFRNRRCVHRKNGCARCLAACPRGAITSNPAAGEDEPQLVIDRQLCAGCAERPCLKVCYFEGLSLCGERRSLAELLHIFERNRPYWGARGGVTFSGGEPLLQDEFMAAALDACRAAHIHVALETSAHLPTARFLERMALVDFALIDLKHLDSDRHREKTGVGNPLILENIAVLGASRWAGRLVLRIPVIPGFNADPDHLGAAAEFMQRVGLAEVNLLPFHRLGASKWAQLGLAYPYRDQPAPSPETLGRLQDLFLDRRIACYVGAETPF